MRAFSWQMIRRIFRPAYGLPESAGAINRRWLNHQAFVLSMGSSILTMVSFPLYHYLTLRPGENAFHGQPHRLAVMVVAGLCFLLPLLFHRLRRFMEYFSFFNLVVLFACIALDISFSERQRRYTTIGLVPLFGSSFVFTNVRVMTAAYGISAANFTIVSIVRERMTEIIVVYATAYFIAWWMAMIRIRSLYRISHDQARLYDRRVYDQRVQLARNLHDSLGGDLMQLSLLLQESKSSPEILDLTDEIILKTRNLVKTLEPRRKNENLSGLIRSYVERLSRFGKFRLQVQIDDAWPIVRIDQLLNIEAIFTEWMTNTIKYSDATVIGIRLRRYDERFALWVIDDGHGFRWNGQKSGSGLRNIALRAILMDARAFSRRRTIRGGTMFVLSGRLQYD